MSNVADKLDQARALIEKGWCQYHSALIARGQIAPYSEAERFCSYGAVTAVDRISAGRMLNLLDQVADGNIIRFNDTPGRTQAEVIDAFKRAAELARSEGK
jgi:hypothetical protein